jgi:hypothetical protein
MQWGFMDNKGCLLFFPCVTHVLIITIINYVDFLWKENPILRTTEVEV